MKNILGRFFNGIFSNKKKILLTVVLSFLFIALFLPKGELRDSLVSQIPEWTGHQLYVEFANWNLIPPPSTGLRLENFLVELQKYPGVHIDQLTVQPALKSFFSKFPLGHIGAQGIFHGDLDFDSQSSDRRSETSLSMEHIALDARNLAVGDIAQTFNLGSSYRGQFNLKINGDVEPTFTDQPDGEINLAGQKLETSDTTVRTMMGPLQLPAIKLGQLNLQGKLANNRFQIERFQINGDDIQGTIKGGLSLVFQNRGGIQVLPGAYTFEIDLLIKPSLESRAGLFLTILDQYKVPSSTGSHYSFKISSAGFEQPPSISAMR